MIAQISREKDFFLNLGHTTPFVSNTTSPKYMEAITANLTRIRVPLGGRAHFWVKLTDNPYTDVRVAVTWQSGNPEISVQRGADLFFTPLNWDLYHPVGLAATRANQDNANPAVFLLSNPAVTPLVVEAETVKGMPQKVGPWLYSLLGLMSY